MDRSKNKILVFTHDETFGNMLVGIFSKDFDIRVAKDLIQHGLLLGTFEPGVVIIDTAAFNLDVMQSAYIRTKELTNQKTPCILLIGDLEAMTHKEIDSVIVKPFDNSAFVLQVAALFSAGA